MASRRKACHHSPCGLDGAEEELGAVGAGSSVGHGEDTRAGVLAIRHVRNVLNHRQRSMATIERTTLLIFIIDSVIASSVDSQGEVLVGELGAVDGLAAGSVSSSEVTSLQKKIEREKEEI